MTNVIISTSSNSKIPGAYISLYSRHHPACGTPNFFRSCPGRSRSASRCTRVVGTGIVFEFLKQIWIQLNIFFNIISSLFSLVTTLYLEIGLTRQPFELLPPTPTTRLHRCHGTSNISLSPSNRGARSAADLHSSASSALSSLSSSSSWWWRLTSYWGTGWTFSCCSCCCCCYHRYHWALRPSNPSDLLSASFESAILLLKST